MKNIMNTFKISILAFGLLMLFFTINQVKAQTSNDFEISKNLEILTSLYKELNNNYVDGVNPSELMKTGIDAMLDKLDPYTVYIPESEIEDYRFMTTGEYGGIGSLIHKQGDYVFISEPYEGSPAQKVGLKAGDKIVSINDKPAKGKSVEDVSSILKGQPGTSFKIQIERPEQSSLMSFEITRQKISVEPVSYYGMIRNDYGYIKLNSFTISASTDVKKAFLDLREKHQLKGLIIDLRDNGGGLLSEAVNIVNLFVKKGELVVTTKGKQKDKNKTYQTTMEPIDLDIPLVILVNGNSASASEIVAGALQDLDRAVIVGRRTYGKGLVQNVLPLSYNTQVKITVAKYYIPSGRCIQAIDYTHKNTSGNPDHIPDSLINAFKTLHGRTVYDGKGILPDVATDTLSISSAAYNLITKYIIFDYATKYQATHPSIASASEFELSESEYADFVNFTIEKNFDFKTVVESELLSLKKAAEYEKCWDDIMPQYEAMKSAIESHKKQDLVDNKKEISDILREEIVSRYYYQKGRTQAALKDDKDIDKATSVLLDNTKYTSILNGSLTKAEKTKSPEKGQN